MKLLSIVTPTYNRSAYLSRCFDSLCAQSDPNFEWIIVDDGSTDDTRQRIPAFRQARPELRIQYLFTEHGGKHAALNAAASLIRGDYVLILDSDDRLTPDAVETVLRRWAEFESPEIGVLMFLAGYSVDDPMAVGAPELTPLDMFGRYLRPIHTRDCCDVFRASAIRQFPFPVFPGEDFLSESVLWHQLAEHYRVVYVNKVIYLVEYLEDGLTKAGRAMRIRRPRGGMYAAELYLDRRYPLPLRLKNGLLYNCYGFFAGTPAKTALRASRAPGLAAMTRPGGWILYRYWKRKYGTERKD